MINWHITPDDYRLVVRIAQKAMTNLPGIQDQRTWIMDLNACHVNGCPLDLNGLLAADGFDFSHDLIGIVQHINRNTGKLEGCFTPRYNTISAIR